jgi:hypothetical protein
MGVSSKWLLDTAQIAAIARVAGATPAAKGIG